MTKRQLLEILSSYKRTIIVFLLLVSANVGLWCYITIFQEPRLVRLQSEWTEKRALGAGGRSDISSLYHKGTADLAAFHDRIPEKREFTRMMMEIFEAAENNGLRVLGTTYKPSTLKDENLVVYGVTLGLEGKYAGIKSFLADLQCQRAMVTVDSLSLSGGKPTEESVNLRISLSAYLRPEAR